MLCQNVREYSQQFMAICILSKFEYIEVVFVDLLEFLLRFV